MTEIPISLLIAVIFGVVYSATLIYLVFFKPKYRDKIMEVLQSASPWARREGAQRC